MNIPTETGAVNETKWIVSDPKWACDILDKVYDEDDTFLLEYRIVWKEKPVWTISILEIVQTEVRTPSGYDRKRRLESTHIERDSGIFFRYEKD